MSFILVKLQDKSQAIVRISSIDRVEGGKITCWGGTVVFNTDHTAQEIYNKIQAASHQ